MIVTTIGIFEQSARKQEKKATTLDKAHVYPQSFIWRNNEQFKYFPIQNPTTEYEITESTDVTEEQAEKAEKEIKDYYDADIDIQKVAKVDASYKYTNYSKEGYIDDSTLMPTTEYYIQFDNTWYYGWGLEINSEIIEQELE